jgi:hypothetical protein
MDENGMDEEEDKDAEEVEAGVNPPILPPIICSNQLHSFESSVGNNDEGEINTSHLTNGDDDCRGPLLLLPGCQAKPTEEVRSGRQEMGQISEGGAVPFLSH